MQGHPLTALPSLAQRAANKALGYSSCAAGAFGATKRNIIIMAHVLQLLALVKGLCAALQAAWPGVDGCCSRRRGRLVRPLALTHHDGSFAAAAQQPRPVVCRVQSAQGLWRVAGNGSLIEDFVARSGTRFVVQSRNGSKGDCETFYFSGANANYMVRGLQGQ